MSLLSFLIIQSLAISLVKMNGFNFAVGTENGYIKIFNRTHEQHSLHGKQKYTSLEYLGKNLLAAGTDNGIIDIWNYHEQKLNMSLSHSTSTISSLLAINETYLLSGSVEGSIKVWSLHNFFLIKLIPGAHQSGIMNLKILPDDCFDFIRFISVGNDNKFKIWTVKEFSLVDTIPMVCLDLKGTEFLDNRMMAYACRSNTRLYILDGFFVFACRPGFPTTSLKKLNSSFLLSGLENGEIKLLDFVDQKDFVFTIEAHSNSVWSMEIVDDILISVAADNLVKLWNTTGMHQINAFKISRPTSLKILQNDYSFEKSCINKMSSESYPSSWYPTMTDLESPITSYPLTHTPTEFSQNTKENMSTEKNTGINQTFLYTFSPFVIYADNSETTYLESNNIAGYLDLMMTKLDLNNCLTNCSNNGRCKFVSERQNLVCECFGNFVGSSCQKDKRACSSNPCLNNGTCINKRGGFKCQCMEEYYFGTNCEKEIDLCANETCSKNGVCVVKENRDILCKCFYLYSGDKCEIESKEMVIKKNVIKTSLIIAIIIILLIFIFLISNDFCSIYIRKLDKIKRQNK